MIINRQIQTKHLQVQQLKKNETSGGHPASTTEGNREMDRIAQEDDNKLAAYDTKKLKQNAEKFIKAFTTYDAKSLSSGKYYESWEGFVLENNENASTLLQQHSNARWNTNSGTYSDILSKCVSIDKIGEPYVSHVTSDGTVAVPVTVTVKHNQGQPGELDWEVMGKYKCDYALYFDYAGNILDVRLQQEKNLD